MIGLTRERKAWLASLKDGDDVCVRFKDGRMYCGAVSVSSKRTFDVRAPAIGLVVFLRRNGTAVRHYADVLPFTPENSDLCQEHQRLADLRYRLRAVSWGDISDSLVDQVAALVFQSNTFRAQTCVQERKEASYEPE